MASKSLLDAFLTLPLSACHAVPFPNLPQLGFGVLNLFKLAFVEDPGWDLVHVRETVHLASYFEHFVSQMIHQPVLMLFFCIPSPPSWLYLEYRGPHACVFLFSNMPI